MEEQSSRDDRIWLELCLQELKEKLRQVLYLKYVLDYDIQSIAQALSIPEGTVKSRIHAGAKIVRERMKGR